MKGFETLHSWMRSSTAMVVLLVILAVLILLLVFHAGVAYGERSVFHRMRGEARAPVPEFGFFSHSFIPQGHGAVGIIRSVALPTLTLQTRDGEMETVMVSSSTILRGAPGMTLGNIQVGQGAVVLGEPENNTEEFTARFITILPGPPPVQ